MQRVVNLGDVVVVVVVRLSAGHGEKRLFKLYFFCSVPAT